MLLYNFSPLSKPILFDSGNNLGKPRENQEKTREKNMALGELFKGKEDPVAKEIESLQLKKASITNNLQAEIQGFQSQIQGKLLEAGTVAFQARQDGSETELGSIWSAIDSLQAMIGQREEKIQEFTQKYDEEMALLGISQGVVATPTIAVQSTVPQVAGSGACTQCGNPLQEGDLFCQSCGNRCS